MSYQLLLFEKQLLSSAVSTQELDILQRNSTTRLKQKLQNNTTLYHSSNETDEQLRMFVFALLVKVFRTYTSKNQSILNSLKQLVYSSVLNPQLTIQQGIEPNQLFKCFAENMVHITIADHVENKISSDMNNSAFFEEVIFAALENKLGINEYTDKEVIVQQLKQYFKQQYDLEVKILKYQNKTVEEKQNQLVLFDNNGHLYKVSAEPVPRNSQTSQEVAKQNHAYFNLTPHSLKQESIKMDISANAGDVTPLKVTKNGSNGSIQSNSSKKIKDFDVYSAEKKKKKMKNDRGVFGMFCCCEE